MTAAAVILAAGRGSRFGGHKMLAELDGRPIVGFVRDLAFDAGLDPVIVVLGEDAEVMDAAVPSRGEMRVRNDDPGGGISGSVRIGIEALATSSAERAVVLLGDQPRLGLDQLHTLLAAGRDTSRPIVVPRYGGTPGTPVVLGREAWPLASQLEGDRGVSQLFASRPELLRYVDVPGVNPDVDTRDDLRRLGRDEARGRSDQMAASGRNRP